MSAPYAECDLDAIVAGVQRQSLQYTTLQLMALTGECVLEAFGTVLGLLNPSPVAAPSSAGAGIPAASEGHPTPLAAT
ncbi:MAG: hypothetical protein U5O16_01120 [Rhodococcus sp. (in: high G+C Gram-positive bacteria)]|uniref:hypothetical protein n=1 Tax=Rhodococcus sp. TaxID=1831 RepID=UPI002AD83533|nr:hypothetical protein [Rhodococcus sp. (in: high G+C Gram-positive bacteria)]